MALTDQATATPTRKVAAAGIAGAVTTIVAFFLLRYVGVELPADVMAGITAVITFGLAYLVRENAPEV